MNLTGQKPYQKSKRSGSTNTAAKRRRNQPTQEDRDYWTKVASLGCVVGNHECRGRVTIHHCGTGAGGRKNHRKVLPLCFEHHLGDFGINSLTGKMSRRGWETQYGSEAELLERVARLLAHV